jgi:hypothetical protein
LCQSFFCESISQDTAAWVESISGDTAGDKTSDHTIKDLYSPTASSALSSSLLTLPTNTPSVTTPVQGPQESDFKISASSEEYNEIVFNLMSAGSSKEEAEQILRMRKPIFSRACREFKKEN